MKRVVVTGMGIVSPIGNDLAEVTDSLRTGRSGIVFSEEYAERGFRSHVAGAPKIDMDDMIARKLRRGLVVTCDYGFERRRLVDARVRRYGTLACYSRQRVHRNPLVLLGRQDLTAHVDFTSLREAGEAEGLDTVALSRQALWLLATAVFEDLDGADLRTREEAMGLLDGEGMGEDIRVLVQARGVEAEAVVALDLLSGRS